MEKTPNFLFDGLVGILVIVFFAVLIIIIESVDQFNVETDCREQYDETSCDYLLCLADNYNLVDSRDRAFQDYQICIAKEGE